MKTLKNFWNILFWEVSIIPIAVYSGLVALGWTYSMIANPLSLTLPSYKYIDDVFDPEDVIALMSTLFLMMSLVILSVRFSSLRCQLVYIPAFTLSFFVWLFFGLALSNTIPLPNGIWFYFVSAIGSLWALWRSSELDNFGYCRFKQDICNHKKTYYE